MLSWSTAQKILCIRLDAIGDVIMTTPAIRALKGNYPDRQITLMTSSSGAAIAPLIPEVDQVIVHNAPWLKATPLRDSPLPEFEIIEQLRQAKFDAAVIFTVYSQNPLPAALICYLAEIPLRLAYCHENPYQLLTDWVKDPEPEQQICHEVQRQLDLVATVGCTVVDPRLKLAVPASTFESVHKILHQAGVAIDLPWVVIHPGATAASRRYPPEQFATVASTLIKKFGIQIVFTGTKAERELVESIRSSVAAPSVSLVDRLNINELTALLALVPLLITNNTGPMHIAAAVQTPIVALYALTNPQHTPWHVPNRTLFYDVPCRYCYKSICPEQHHHCLELVEPEQVVQAAIDLCTAKELTPYSYFSITPPCSTSSFPPTTVLPH
jgi:lipopolysaccharide heptosyltransferase II